MTNVKKVAKVPLVDLESRKLIFHNIHGEEDRRRCLWCATVSSTAALQLLLPSCTQRCQVPDIRTAAIAKMIFKNDHHYVTQEREKDLTDGSGPH